MNFSLILPSRERLPLLRDLLASVRATALDLHELEVWIAFDEDDTESIRAISTLTCRYPFAHFAVFERQGNMSTYYNRLATICTGRYVWALNDDCVLTGDGWDRTDMNGIWYGKTHDDCGLGYPNFPLLSRQALDAAGYFFNPGFTSWGADINCHDIWQKVGLVTDLPAFKVQHRSHHNGTRGRDAVNVRMGEIARYAYETAEGEAKRIQSLIECLT